MYVKMYGRGVANDATATYRLWQQVQGFQVYNALNGDEPIPGVYKITLDFEDGHSQHMDVTGNVYVMNDKGTTIDSFTVDLKRLFVPLFRDERARRLLNDPAHTRVRVMPESMRGQSPVSDRPGNPGPAEH